MLCPLVLEVVLGTRVKVHVGEDVAGPARHVEDVLQVDDPALVAVGLATNFEVD